MTDRGDADALLHVTVRFADRRATLTLTGELDLLSGSGLADALDAVLASDAERLDVQMRQVSFADVAGVRILVRAYEIAARHQIVLTLLDPQPHISWLLEATGAAALLLGPDGAAPAPRTAHPVAAHRGRPEETACPRDRRADERDRRADERDRRAAERERRADERDWFAQERDRLLDERTARILEQQRWEDIREDLTDARERNLDRREDGR